MPDFVLDTDPGLSPCIEWTGPRSPITGYGKQYLGILDGRKRWGLPHRSAYEAVNGPIPEGMQIDHLCRNRLCINVLHLEAVTPSVNTRRALGWVGDTCPRGHAQPEQGRCRECKRKRQNEWQARKWARDSTLRDQQRARRAAARGAA